MIDNARRHQLWGNSGDPEGVFDREPCYVDWLDDPEPPNFERQGFVKPSIDEATNYYSRVVGAMAQLQETFSRRLLAPSLHALIDDYPVEFSNLEDKFEVLALQWRNYNLGRSRIEYNHFAHYQIIGMGMSVVPLLLARMQRGENIWLAALKAITGSNPVGDIRRGDSAAVRRAWIEWGMKHGYGVFIEQALASEANAVASLEETLPPEHRLE